MNNPSSFRRLAPVFATFYIVGFLDLVGVATGYIQKDFGLSDSAAQLIPSMAFFWFALVSIPTGIFQDRQGKRRTVVLSMLITAVGLILPFLYYSYAFAVLGFMIIGIGNTMLQVSANPLLLDVSSGSGKSANLSLSQFIKAISSMLGPIFISLLTRILGDWRWIFPLYAIVTLLTASWLASVRMEETKPEKARATLRSILGLLRNRFLVKMILSTALMVGFDVGINSNIANMLSSKHGISLESAGIGISLYFASLMAGRFLGSFLLRKFSPQQILIVGVTVNLLGLAGVFLSNHPIMTGVMIFITGFGFANLFPIIFALTIERMPEYANEISALIILSICGGALIPPIMGFLSDNYGATSGLCVLAACILYTAYAIGLLRKETT